MSAPDLIPLGGGYTLQQYATPVVAHESGGLWPASPDVIAAAAELSRLRSEAARWKGLADTAGALVDATNRTNDRLRSEAEGLRAERDQWAAKWQDMRRKYADLRWPGMTGEVHAMDAAPVPAAHPQATVKDSLTVAPQVEALRDALRRIEGIAGEQVCAHLDGPTDFAIANARWGLLTRIKRAARAALAGAAGAQS